MISFVLRRLLSVIPVLLIVSVVAFALLYILPGDPALAMVGERNLGSEVYLALRHEMGLDDPVYVQYGRWLWNLVQGNFGTSLSKIPVSQLLGDKIVVSLNLGLAGLFISLLIGIPMALLSALKKGRIIDSIATFIAVCGAAIPAFWLAALLMYFFGVKLRILPVSGYVPLAEDPLLHFKLLLMPAFSIGFRSAAIIMRQGRASLIAVLGQEYITTARSKGIGEAKVIRRHAIKNAMGPIVTILGMQLGAVISGAVITETVFAIPGVGLMAVDAIFSRDLVVLQAAVIVLTFTAIIGNLLADIAYGFFDPRIRYQ